MRYCSSTSTLLRGPAVLLRPYRYAVLVRTVSTMPPKRKRTDEAPAPAPAPAPAARRSSRRVKDNPDGANATPVARLNGNVKRGKRTAPSTASDERNDAPQGDGLKQAVAELTQMEEKFQSDLKRQRLAVETSDLMAETQEPGDKPFKPKLIKAEQGTVDELPDSVPDEIEQAPPDEYSAELAEGDVAQAKVDEDKGNRGAKRPPPVNSSVLPLPWNGRLGYACLNTYLRNATPPVFSSRTCRIASIIEHRHPLKDPSQPEHATKNRPDREQPADYERGLKYVQDLGLANARDIPKMLRWNHKYGIKFMRLSSEMFPFASHHEHGYKLAPFASEALAEAGKVAAKLGHRLTTHPGQFTQIGSPRKEVVTAAIRDLEYHDEMLSLLKLPEQMDRDAVMILHLGGVYGDKGETLKRFKENYKALPQGVKNRMVLENDDVSWSVHDLLPVCEELNIPMVLDFHHHNIVFDPEHLREGSHDILDVFDRIRATWTRKGITQKMHYSEQTASAVTPRDRRKHSARVKTLPPCGTNMDLMIEAKDKEQAVFELMRTFKLPGWDTFNDVVPHEREDEYRKAVKKKGVKKSKKKAADGEEPNPDDDIEIPERIVSDEDHGMGGPESRVYWPEGMEEWLRPKKREVAKKTPTKGKNGAEAKVKQEVNGDEDED